MRPSAVIGVPPVGARGTDPQEGRLLSLAIRSVVRSAAPRGVGSILFRTSTRPLETDLRGRAL